MDNKDKILMSALKLFGTKGYEATGVQEIASLAGITKPTLYHYFGSKKGLLKTLLTDYNQKLNHNILLAAQHGGNIEERLTNVTNAFFSFAQNNRDFYRMQLAMVFGPLEGDPIAIIRDQANAPYQILQKLFTNTLTPSTDANTDICMAHAVTFIGIVHQYITLYLNGLLELSDKTTTFIVHNFMYGFNAA